MGGIFINRMFNFPWCNIFLRFVHITTINTSCVCISFHIITGRNEVLAKVIFSQASVCPRGGGGGIPACLAGQSQRGGLVPGVSNFSGGSSNFSGGLQFFGGSPIFRNTVNVWPVHILLECILVYSEYSDK